METSVTILQGRAPALSMSIAPAPHALYLRPLLATDLSEGAEAAALLASHVIAPSARGTALMVLSEPELPGGIPDDVRDELVEAVRRREKDAAQELDDWLRNRGLSGWRADAPMGRVASTIVHSARVLGADVILTGSSGHGRVERGLLGSVSRAVLHRAGVDVLVARHRATNGPLRQILIATDFHEPSRSAARRALAIATNNDAKLTLLHVIDRGEWMGALAPPEGFDASAWRKHTAEELATFNRVHLQGRADEALTSGRAARSIVAKAAELEADLVVLGTFGGGPISRALLGSVADAVAERAACSVLVVRGGIVA